MGSGNSKPKTVYDILGISPTTTKEEARKRFIHLVKKEKDVKEIISAYEEIKRSPPPLDFYTEELLKSDLEKYAGDVYGKIGDYTGEVTRWGSPDFYRVFLNFQSPRPVEFNLKVRKLTRLIRGISNSKDDDSKEDGKDDGKDEVSKDQISYPTTSFIPPTTRTKEKEFKCEGCRKGFRSTNQLLKNHLRSRRHQEKYPKEFIENQIAELTTLNSKEDGRVVDRVEDECIIEDSKVKDNIHNTPLLHYYKAEPLIFRTCSRCREVFPTRREMLSHIKERHPKGD